MTKMMTRMMMLMMMSRTRLLLLLLLADICAVSVSMMVVGSWHPG